tara:strand:+ start:697 stop:909 length:213 start_codon:yes stop_codon:yes gene_type:complete
MSKSIKVEEFPVGHMPSLKEITDKIYSIETNEHWDTWSVIYLIKLLSLADAQMTRSASLLKLATSLEKEQ